MDLNEMKNDKLNDLKDLKDLNHIQIWKFGFFMKKNFKKSKF